MGRNKFGKYILIGALTGAVVSLSDKHTRDQIVNNSKNIISYFRFYVQNPDVLKSKMQEKTEKYQSVYEQFSSDAAYLKEKVEEIKTLSPHVKALVVDTKDAFSESKDEYKTIVNENLIG
mgnify:CR=1 FL=1